MNNQISEQQLQNQVMDLPQEITPSRDLWPGIERAIENHQQQKVHANKTHIPIAWAASVLAAVLLTWVSLKPNVVVNESPLSLLSVMQQGFEQQKSTMLVSFGQPNIADLPKDIQQQLEELSQARQSVEKALKTDPSNTDLINILRWTQKQEIDLLKQLYSPQWQTI